MPIWCTGGTTQFEQETVIFVDQLKRNGINASPALFPTTGSREDRVMLPGIWAHGAGLKGPKVRLVTGAGYPTRNIHEWEWVA